jgi:hypothetical protein
MAAIQGARTGPQLEALGRRVSQAAIVSSDPTIGVALDALRKAIRARQADLGVKEQR